MQHFFFPLILIHLTTQSLLVSNIFKKWYSDNMALKKIAVLYAERAYYLTGDKTCKNISSINTVLQRILAPKCSKIQ